MTIDTLLRGFKRKAPKVLDVWRRYPDVSEAEDESTDAWACDEASRLFAAYAASEGFLVEIVRGDGAFNPHADYHVWVRIFDRDGGSVTNIDWTARQYHNLTEPYNDRDVLAEPWPMLWYGERRVHPVVGRFNDFSTERVYPRV